jgi:hypothetical protein
LSGCRNLCQLTPRSSESLTVVTYFVHHQQAALVVPPLPFFFFFFLFSISSPDLAFICSLCLPFYRYSTLFCIIIIGAERSDLQGAC